MKTSARALAAALTATPLAAQDQRELEAHVHGVSTMELAIEGEIVEISLLSPGMDIVGFEYEAESAADKDKVADAIGVLSRPSDLIVLDAAAGCRLSEVQVHLESGDDDEHEHEEHTEGEEHDHEDHAEGEDHDHDDHAEGEEHEEHGEHSAFHARYAFACDNPDALTSIAFPFFELFPNAQEIEAQFVTESGAGSAEVGRDDPTLPLK